MNFHSNCVDFPVSKLAVFSLLAAVTVDASPTNTPPSQPTTTGQLIAKVKSIVTLIFSPATNGTVDAPRPTNALPLPGAGDKSISGFNTPDK
jgi:hypothetical protein